MRHDGRKHSTLSPSASSRWLECTPSALLEMQFPKGTTDASQEGTLAHELAEIKLRNYFFTTDFGKQKFTRAVNKLKKEELWDNEMLGYTDDYLDYIKSVALAMPSAPSVMIEAKVNLDAYVPHLPGEDEASGSADCILICGGTMHVIDFKYGKGVPVSAASNPQLMLYALGAYEAYKILYPITDAVMHIVQPRLPDGTSSWGCTVAELLEFGAYVKERAALAIKGEGEFRPGEKTCRFCRARGRCRARAEEDVKLAFAIGKLPPLITNEEMGQYLKQGADVAKWLSDLKDCALAECLAGKEVPGWKAVEGRGSRDWTDADKAFSLLQEKGVPEAVLYERKALTLAQVEKVVGKKEFAEYVGGYVAKKPGKPALVEESDNRPAITNKVTAAEAFEGVTG